MAPLHRSRQFYQESFVRSRQFIPWNILDFIFLLKKELL